MQKRENMTSMCSSMRGNDQMNRLPSRRNVQAVVVGARFDIRIGRTTSVHTPSSCIPGSDVWTEYRDSETVTVCRKSVKEEIEKLGIYEAQP